MVMMLLFVVLLALMRMFVTFPQVVLSDLRVHHVQRLVHINLLPHNPHKLIHHPTRPKHLIRIAAHLSM